MKKRIISLIISSLLLIISLYAESNEFEIQVPKEYCGTYLPEVCLEYFDKTLNFEKAQNIVPKDCHDVLAVKEDICLSDVSFHDGYAIEKEEFAKFKFEEKGKDLFIIDGNGYKYKRFSLVPNCYREVSKYVSQKLFECVDDLRNVEVIGDELFIENVGFYSLVLDSMWYSTPDTLAILSGDGLKTNGISGGLYNGVQRGSFMAFDVSDEEVFHFPLLSYTPLIPLEEMSGSELRLYRNLQFARHGYKFKSKDLQEIFAQFEWYTPQKNNNGIKLTKEEQDIVNKCLDLEKEKKEILSKNKLLTLSEEEKKQYITGVWYNTPSPRDNSCGYVFYSDGTFEYKDTESKIAKAFYFSSCKGEWKIVDNDIYIKIKKWREINNQSNERFKGKEYIEYVHQRPAFFKIGSLASFTLGNGIEGKKGELAPSMLCYVLKDDKQQFYYEKEESEYVDYIDFYDTAITTKEKSRVKFQEYFKTFFEGKDFSVSVKTEYKSPLFIAQSFIDKENNICDKVVIYLLEDGFINVLLNFNNSLVTTENDIVYSETMIGSDGWKINIKKDERNNPLVYIIPKKGNEFKEERCYPLEIKNTLNFKGEYKTKPYKLTEDVIILPKGTDGTRGKESQYVLFGDWPQSLKENNVYVDISKSSNINGWECYKGNDGYYYTKANDRDAFYKIEPIKWCVISDEYQGGKLLLAEDCLYYTYFYESDYGEPLREIDGKIIENYDYKYSDIRAWLNGLDGSSYKAGDFRKSGMLYTAFTKNAIDKINTVEIKTIDNEIIKDKLFLLEDEQVANDKLGFSSQSDAHFTRVKKTTDFCRMLYKETRQNLTGEWWLRTPRLNCGPREEGPSTVFKDGKLRHNIARARACVVPALSVSF